MDLEDLKEPRLDWNKIAQELAKFQEARIEQVTSLRKYPKSLLEKLKFKDSFAAYCQVMEKQLRTEKIYNRKRKPNNTQKIKRSYQVKRKRECRTRQKIRCNTLRRDIESDRMVITEPEQSQELSVEWNKDNILDYLMEDENSPAGVNNDLHCFEISKDEANPREEKPKQS